MMGGKPTKYVYLKLFECKNQKLVAACDEEILGKTFREGKIKLEISKNFYKGERVAIINAIEVLHKADIANLSGASIIKEVIKRGLADKRSVISISGIPHLQIMKL